MGGLKGGVETYTEVSSHRCRSIDSRSRAASKGGYDAGRGIAKKLLRELSGRRPRKRARRSTPVATHGRSTRTRRGPAKSYAQSDTDSDGDDVAKRPRPPPRSPGPLPKDSTCCICLDPVLRRRDAIIFECDHFVCKSCSSDLARHTAEAGAVSTRRGVSVTCPLCRRRAKLEISN